MKYLTLIFLLVPMTTNILAQTSDQSTSVNIGVVESAERVALQQSSGAGGALVGAAIGYNLGSGKSSSKKRRHAIIGGSIGARASAKDPTEGMKYTVKFLDGSTISLVSDQFEIKIGDCVSVEQVKDTANIRHQDPAACNPDVKEAVAELQDELIEDANECAAAKQELLDATTMEAVEIATAKAKILCN
jgi:outer membrane lipoprotein SlyB